MTVKNPVPILKQADGSKSDPIHRFSVRLSLGFSILLSGVFLFLLI